MLTRIEKIQRIVLLIGIIVVLMDVFVWRG
jgi:hypothetical protein